MKKEKTFVKITNTQIFEKLCEIERRVIVTNGKVKLNKWIATTAISLCCAIILTALGVKVF